MVGALEAKMKSGVIGLAAAIVPWGIVLLGHLDVVCLS
jgi:hypothetical protein